MASDEVLVRVTELLPVIMFPLVKVRILLIEIELLSVIAPPFVLLKL